MALIHKDEHQPVREALLFSLSVVQGTFLMALS